MLAPSGLAPAHSHRSFARSIDSFLSFNLLVNHLPKSAGQTLTILNAANLLNWIRLVKAEEGNVFVYCVGVFIPKRQRPILS